MLDHADMVLASLGILFIGLSKAGFGGSIGMMTTPLCVLAFGPRDAIGILLPLLSAGDLFSLYHYWGKWERRNLWLLLPGAVAGVLAGVQLIDAFNARQLNATIGVLAVLFVTFQTAKHYLFRSAARFEPTFRLGIPCGVGAGFTSAVAHGAGPVMMLFLIPQRLPKEVFVGTNVLVFTWINWIKMPFYLSQEIIHPQTIQLSLAFLPLVPLGVWLGVWLNRKVSEDLFARLTHVFTFLTGVYLIFGFQPRA